MARIEVALARIESVRPAPPVSHSEPREMGPSEAETQLRAQVESAISKLDALIGSLEA